MEKLEEYRKEIEQIDEQMIDLIVKRMNLSKKIGEFKKENNLPVFDPNREEALKEKNLSKMDEIYKAPYLEIFETILKVSKNFQL